MTRSQLCSATDLPAWIANARGGVVSSAGGLSLVLDSLLSWGHLNDILNHRNLSYPQIYAVLDGEPVETDAFLLPESPARYSRLKPAIFDLLKRGGGLFVRELERVSAAISEFSASLERCMNAAISCEMELRMASVGRPEWRSVDLVLLQVAGSRQVSVYGVSVLSPIAGFCGVDAPPQADPDRVFVLGAGDALYLPRGCWFACQSEDGPNLTLSLSISTLTGVDFARWLVRRIALNKEEMRKDVPNPAAQDKSYVSTILRLIIEALQREDSYAEFLQESHGLARTGTRIELPFQLNREVDISNPRTVVSSAMPRRFVIRVDPALPDAIDLVANGSRLAFRPESLELLRFVRDSDSFALETFYNRFGGQCEIHQLHQFIQDLINAGVLSVSWSSGIEKVPD